MATVKEDIKKQRQEYEDTIPVLADNLQTSEIEVLAESSIEELSITDQLFTSQKRMEELIDNRKCKLPKEYVFEDAYCIDTPYGKTTLYSLYTSDSFDIDLCDSYTESDKIGRKYLKKHNIKTNDTSIAKDITEYYVATSIATSIEKNKNLMTENEYKEAKRLSQERLRLAIKNVNQKGYIVNTKSGELEYKNPQIQQRLLAQQSR